MILAGAWVRLPQCLLASWKALASTAIILAGCFVLLISQAQAQDTPLLSGGVGFFSSTNNGNTTLIPTISPVLVAPLGDRFQIESQANLLELFAPTGNGYDTLHYVALSYLQGDYIANSHLTVVVGSFLSPFGTYTERLSPIWIYNLQDSPLIYSIGTGTGTGVGGMLRGNAYSSSKISIDYVAYYSVHSNNEQFSGARSTGFRLDSYFPRQSLELGVSFTRLLQDDNANAVGFHVWWLPQNSGFQFRSEYAQTTHTSGYWFETDYRPSRFGGERSAIGRAQPVFRMQQTFRNAPDPADGQPLTNTQQADFYLDYFLPHEVRINGGYSREFSSLGNRNLWKVGIVYRFLFPAWRTKQ